MRFARSIVAFLFVISSIALSAVMASASPGVAVSPINEDNVTADTLAQALVGPGVSISNVSYTGANGASGTFSGGNGIIGFEDGIVLTSGSVTNVVGPNSSDATSTNNQTPGDGDLEALSGVGSGTATTPRSWSSTSRQPQRRSSSPTSSPPRSTTSSRIPPSTMPSVSS